MHKQELLELFNIKNIYQENTNFFPLALSYYDNLLGTENAVSFIFNDNDIKIIMITEELANMPQRVEFEINFYNDKTLLNTDTPLINEPFNFLNLQADLNNSLTFLADYINRILIPKFQLKGNITRLY